MSSKKAFSEFNGGVAMVQRESSDLEFQIRDWIHEAQELISSPLRSSLEKERLAEALEAFCERPREVENGWWMWIRIVVDDLPTVNAEFLASLEWRAKRAVEQLTRANTMLADLVCLSAEDICKLPDVGEVTVREIQNALRKMGLWLHMTERARGLAGLLQ